MKLPRLTTSRVVIALGFATLVLAQAASSAYQRYLRCLNRAANFAASEDVYRRTANVREELAPRLREVATLARELAKSATTDFERKKWLEMARLEEEKADQADREAIHLMTRADAMAARANAHTRLAWRPWSAESE